MRTYVLNSMGFLAVASLLLLTHCQPSGPAVPAIDPATPHFQWSKAPIVLEKEGKANWCNLQFAEGVPINADATNFNRRFFMLNSGTYRVVVRVDDAACSFLLKKKNATTVEIFTDNNFPHCLSSHTNFTLSESGTDLKYTSSRIEFPLSVLPTTAAGTLQIILELPLNSNYGMLVHREPGK